jgi:carbamoyl-phosphate synthase large subunit
MGLDSPITVMVTGVGGGGLGEQIVKALRLAAGPYEIVGGDMDPHSKGLTEVEHPVVLPPASDPGYLDAVLGVCRARRVAALFPGSEAELKVLDRRRELIAGQGLFLPINSSPVLEICLDKSKTSRWLADHGFSAPPTYQIREAADLRSVPDDILPAALKPAVGGGGSNNLHLAQTRAELKYMGAYLLWNLGEFIVQQYVGSCDSEYTVGVLSDLEGRLINSIALKRSILSGLSNRIKVKNRTAKKELGEILAVSNGISQGELGRFPAVTAECERIAEALDSRGALNIQCRLHEGRVYVFEINPRFSGTTSLRALAGYNEPDILLRRHLKGEAITPHFKYREGQARRGLSECFQPMEPSR